MKNFKKIGLGLMFALIGFTVANISGVYRASALGGSPATDGPQEQLLQNIQKGNYHFWIDPGFPNIMNFQVPKDSDPTKNHYVLQKNSTDPKTGDWIYTVAGTTNPNLLCSSSNVAVGDLTNSINSISNAVAKFTYVVPGPVNTCSSSTGHGTISNVNIDITNNASGTPGTGQKGASCNTGADCVNGTCQKDNGVCTTNNVATNTSATCESSSSTGFEWLFCPVFRMFDGIISTLTGVIENLLDFNVSTYLNPQVKDSWSIMKNLASALLVIVLLVAVISQAVGGGPFDAYTLRKILPRLVIAVIIIQLSWYLLYWAINVADDLGHGVRDLICAPFGGWNNLDLNHLVGQLGGAAKVTTGALTIGLGIAFVFSGLTAFGLGMLGLSAVMTDLLAFCLLVLRQVLIVMSVILFPIALTLWILPGTQRYWKLWSDNFIKLLMLFPLIMAMIYAGRVFAHIFILATTGPGASDSDRVIATLVLFIAFFGPYWFMPKAFKWGGQMYAAASSGVMNATQNARAFPRKYALSRAQENRQYRGERRAARIGQDPEAASRFDRLMAGGYNLARSRGARERQYARTVAEGQKAAREAVSEELLTAGYQNWGHDQKLAALEAWLRGESYAGISAEGNDELRLFAFKTLADLGDQDRIRRARQEGKLRGSVWLKGRAENISQLNAQASDMGIEADLSGVSPDKMAGWKGHTWQEWFRQVQEGVYMDNSDDGGGDIDISEVRDSTGKVIGHDPAKRDAQLARAQAQAKRILDNQLVFDRLSYDQQEIVKKMASGEGTQVIETRLEGGVQVPAGATLDTNATARQNVMASLADPARGKAAATANSLAPRIIEAARAADAGIPLTANQQGDMQLFHQVLDRGTAPDATPEMHNAINELAKAINASLAGHEAETERQLTASGSPAVAAAVATERERSDDVRRTLGI